MFPKKTKILIADDMAMFRQMLKQALATLEFPNYHEFVDGAAAWQGLQGALEAKVPFELIISDWSMPKMKGIELLKKVRASPWGTRLPFVMLTGEAEKENIVEAVQSGVTQYIIKPFTVESLQQKLKLAYDKFNASSPAKGEIVNE